MADLQARVGEVVVAYAERFPLRLGVPKEECRRKCKFKAGANEWHALCAALAPEAEWVLVGDRMGPTVEGPVLSAALTGALAAAAAELRAFGLEWPGLATWEAQSPVLRTAATDGQLAAMKPAEVLRYLVDHGQAVAINTEYYVSPESMTDLHQRLRAEFAQSAEITFADFRQLSGLSRKLGIPLLEYLDQNGVTVRVGDVRRAGEALNNTPPECEDPVHE